MTPCGGSHMHKKKTVLVNVLHGNTWHPKRKVNNQTELLVFYCFRLWTE